MPLNVAGTPVGSGSNTGTGAQEDPALVAMPSGIVAGELLLFGIRIVGDRVVTPPAGWTLIETPDATMQTNGALWLYAREATGSEGATISVDLSSSARWVANAYRIEGAHGVSGGIEAELAYEGVTLPDSPAITPSWGSAENLVIVFGSVRRTTMQHAAPSPYANQLDALGGLDASDSTSYTRLHSARRKATFTTETPGSWVYSGTGDPNRGQSATVAIRPAA